MLMMRRRPCPDGTHPVTNFVAQPDRRTLGGTLAAAFLADCRRRGLSLALRPANDAIADQYRKAGFVDTGRGDWMVWRSSTSER
jgi:hypothetical protein